MKQTNGARKPSGPNSGQGAELPAGVVHLARRAQGVIQDARNYRYLVDAYAALQERDAQGNPRGSLPYAEAAFAPLHEAHARFPEDVRILHHLAIAYHARAWDRELANHPEAMNDWDKALGYWRRLAASSEFWAEMKRNMVKVDAEADASSLDEMRSNILDNLLGIHVGFIQAYYESNQPERAAAHVDIVRRAQIPPAVRRRLCERVYVAMTSAVPEALGRREYESALVLVERFLELFAGHLPALRACAEIARDWAATMSYREKWHEIERLATRVTCHIHALSSHPGLQADALAQKALNEVCATLGEHALKRGYGALQEDTPMTSKAVTLAEAQDQLRWGIGWCRLAFQGNPSFDGVQDVLGPSLFLLGQSLRMETGAILEDPLVDGHTKIRTAVRLLREAIGYMTESVALVPQAQEGLDATRQELASLEGLL